jgi:hypothetical protein
MAHHQAPPPEHVVEKRAWSLAIVVILIGAAIVYGYYWYGSTLIRSLYPGSY